MSNANGRRTLVLALAVISLAACGPGSGADTSSSAAASHQIPSQSLEPPDQPAPTTSTVGVTATFAVGSENYKILLTDTADIALAVAMLSGKQPSMIPNGTVVRGEPDVNVGYSWHIDPTSLEFADVTTEICDGLPSDVEAQRISGTQFCPWSARLVRLDPMP